MRKQLILKLAVGEERRSSVMERAPIHPVILARPKRLNWGVAGNELSTGNAHVGKNSDALSRSSSSAIFRTGTQAIHRDQLRYLQRLTFWVKVCIIGSSLCLIAMIAAFISFCKLEVGYVESLFTLIEDFQQIEIWSLKAGLVARDIAMIDAGLHSDENSVRDRATQAGEILKAMAEETRSRLSTNPELWGSVETNDNLWWEFEQNRFVPHHKNLMDTLESLSSICLSLSKPNTSASVPQLLTLYRNADTETFIYTDRKYRELVQRGKEEMQMKGPVIVLLLCVSEVVVIVEVCLLVTVLCLLERFRRKIWYFILSMPQLLVSLTKSIVANRLSIEFGQDCQPEEHFHKSKAGAFAYHRSSYEVILYSVSALTLLGSISFLIFSVLQFITELSAYNSDLTKVEDVSMDRVTNKLQTLIYMKESVLGERLKTLRSHIWGFEPVSNYSAAWEQALETDRRIEKEFCELIQVAETSVFAANYESLGVEASSLHMGLHAGLGELVLRQRELRTGTARDSEREALAIEGLYYEMESSLVATLDSVNAGLKGVKADKYYKVIEAVAVFSGMVVIILVAVVYPLILKVPFTQFVHFIKREWNLLLLFQDDEQGSLSAKLKSFNKHSP